VETLAAFGSIFLLFGHGMLYSSHYYGNHQGVMPETFTTGVFILGVIFFILLILCGMFVGLQGKEDGSIMIMALTRSIYACLL